MITTNWSWHVRGAEYCQRLNGKVRTRKHYRCGQCRARRSLKRELWDYIRPPKCRECYAVDWRLDMSRTKEWLTRTGVFNTCNCGGYFFPHRRGGGVWCYNHIGGPTDQDYANRYGR